MVERGQILGKIDLWLMRRFFVDCQLHQAAPFQRLIQVTVILKKVSLGNEIDIVQEGLPDVIPLEACYIGWHQSLQNLTKLVEPDINQ